MDKKTLANITAFGLCFLLWVNFGVEAIWLILAIGFALLLLFVIFTTLLQFFFFNFYKNTYSPVVKRITGMDLSIEPIREGISAAEQISFLGLDNNEEILFHKKLDLFTHKVKNGKSILRNYLIVTSANMIIADSRSKERKDVVRLSDIVSIEGKMKFILTFKAKPFLRIRSVQNDVYEIALSAFKRNILEINEIAAIIKRVNPQVEINVNDFIGNEPVYGEQDKRLLFLLPILMVLLGLALWRLFQYVRAHGFNEVPF